MYIEEIKHGFPDCIARRFTGKGWERIRVEFEFKSSNFKAHDHDPKDCDMVICWEHDWKDCPIEVIELHSAIQDMENIPIKRPGKTYDEPDLDKTLDALFARGNTQQTIRVWWEQIYEKLQEHDADIWLNIGKKYVGLYSPERSFASFKLTKTSLVFECFTRGQSMQGVKVASKKYSPRWGRFSVKHEDAIDFAIGNLIEAQARLKAAIKAGEQTSYYSGGQGFGKSSSENNVDEFNDENI